MILIDSVRYKGKKTSVENLSFDIKEFSFHSIESTLPLIHLFIDLIRGKMNPDEGTVSTDFVLSMDHLGIVYEEDYFYERFKVKEYLAVFRKLHKSSLDLEEHLREFDLLDVANVRIGELAQDYRRKLSLARECFKDLKLLIVVEPIRNLDIDSSKTMMSLLYRINKKGSAVLTLSTSFKEALMIQSTVYHLTEAGLQVVHEDAPYKSPEETDPIKISRISARLQDKWVVFNPYEIDYVESNEGQCTIHVKGSQFTSNETLNELEAKLVHFGFFRSHRSYVVNLQKIIEIISWSKDSFSVVLNDKQKSTVPLSKGRIQALKQILSISSN